MTNNLVPTPIVDKNGRRTTVRKKPAGAGPVTKPVAPPSRPVPEEVVGTPLPVVHPLSFGEVEEFLAFLIPVYHGPGGAYGHIDPVIASPSVMGDLNGSFRALSGVSQGMVARVRRSGAIDDNGVIMAIYRAHWKADRFWNDISGSRIPAEELMRAVLRVAERIHEDRPGFLAQFHPAQVQSILEDSVGGYFCNDTLFAKPHELSTVEEVAAVAGTAAYMLTCSQGDTKFMKHDSFNDPAGLIYSALVVHNKTLGKHLREHPEDAVRAAEFVMERDIGKSKQDAQHVIDYLASSAPAISEGYL